MMKITCNIIKDLIPSYVDGICSEDSKVLINEHMKKCQLCNEYYKSMVETEFTDEATNYEQVNYLKRIQHSFVYSVLMPILFFAIVITVVRGNLSYRGTYVLMLLGLTISMFLQCKTRNVEKQSIGLWGLTIAPIGYCAFVFTVLLQAVDRGTPVFNIPLERFGPVMDLQLILSMAVELLVFCVIRFQTVTKEVTSTVNLVFSVIFAGILLAWDSLLYQMTSAENLTKVFAEIVIVSLCMGGLSILIGRIIKKRFTISE